MVSSAHRHRLDGRLIGVHRDDVVAYEDRVRRRRGVRRLPGGGASSKTERQWDGNDGENGSRKTHRLRFYRSGAGGRRGGPLPGAAPALSRSRDSTNVR